MLHTRFYLAAAGAKGMKIKRAEDNSMNILKRRGKIAFKNSARFIEDRFWNGSFRIKKNELVARDVYISRVYPGIKSGTGSSISAFKRSTATSRD